MSRAVRTHFDGAKVSELRSFLFHLLNADPSAPAEGQFYWNTLTHRPRFYTGSAFSQAILALDTINALTAPAADFSMNTHKITNLTAGTASTDAASLTNKITDFATPTSSLAMGAQKITGLANGTASTDAATYGQLLTVQQGMDWKDSVRVATIAALSPSNSYSAGVLTAGSNGALTVDGITVAVGNRILVKNEATASNNGIYTVTATGSAGAVYVLTRAVDADTSAKVTANFTVAASEGSLADTWWQLTTNDAIVLDTTGLTFAQIGQGTTYVGGAGLTLTGATFDVVAAAGSGIIVNADNIDIDPTNGLPVNRGGTGAITAVGAKTNLLFMTRSAGLVGDGSSTTLTYTHNLNTKDVHVSVRVNSTDAEIDCDVLHNNVNSVDLVFSAAPTTNELRVVVMG